MIKTIGIAGLGLIGGSMAKAIKKNENFTVLGYDKPQVLEKAAHIIDGILNEETIATCDLLLICLYPKATIDFAKNNLKNFKKGTIIVDCAGVKTNICENLSEVIAENNCYFIGGHPMAGLEKSGFDYSSSDLFDGATMVLCKDNYTNTVALSAAEIFFRKIGFDKITYSTFEEHDKIIAFTSQLAHVVSSAYVQSETAKMQMGFSAGSYQDLTRVAYLNENMWTELFLENKKPLANEVRSLSKRLEEYANAIENNDSKTLCEMLYQGKKMKEMVG